MTPAHRSNPNPSPSMISTYSPHFLHELGKRTNNEDAVYPQAPGENESLFLVCDGVGGNEKGEVASRLACGEFAAYFGKHPVAFSDEKYIDEALAHVQSRFDDYLHRHEAARGMATTLTLLHLHGQGATIAHIGDSRVYHVRGARILWHTTDHSLMNEYVKAGVLKPEEALHHPQKSVITRAIQGSHKPTQADVHHIPPQRLQADDYFFLCTDGVLESISDSTLETVLGNSGMTDREKIDSLKSICQNNSKDNFSAYLVRLRQVAPPPVKPSARLPRRLVPLLMSLLLLASGLLGWQLKVLIDRSASGPPAVAAEAAPGQPPSRASYKPKPAGPRRTDRPRTLSVQLPAVEEPSGPSPGAPPAGPEGGQDARQANVSGGVDPQRTARPAHEARKGAYATPTSSSGNSGKAGETLKSWDIPPDEDPPSGSAVGTPAEENPAPETQESLERQYLEKDCRNGDPDACYELGKHYEEGKGDLARDVQKAKHWMEEALRHSPGYYKAAEWLRQNPHRVENR